MEYILSCSYGKDSLACIGACIELGWKIDRIVHAEVWATETIPADLPPMVKFKEKADKIIKERYGITVEHLCATRGGKKQLTEITFTENSLTESIKEKFSDTHTKKAHGATVDSKQEHLIKSQKVTYQSLFYRVYQKGKRGGDTRLPNFSQ